MEVQGQYYIGLLHTESQCFVDAQLLKQIQITHGNANAAYGRGALAYAGHSSQQLYIDITWAEHSCIFSFTSGPGQIKTEQDIRSSYHMKSFLYMQ